MSAQRWRVHNWPFWARIHCRCCSLPPRPLWDLVADEQFSGPEATNSDGLRSRVTDVCAVCGPTICPSPCSDSAVMTRGLLEDLVRVGCG